MCRNCYCEGYDQCSVVGYQGVDFCCERCIYYNNGEPCLYPNKSELQIPIQKPNNFSS
ncbi:MAG: hypothetical protein GF364_22490 [Candidatus Lokiarchaeota archaeon]|nr:hypothetical protein [Candidatus Lokiarchaeota archaeon]